MFCPKANQSLIRNLKTDTSYAKPIIELEEVGIIKEEVFGSWKQFGEFLCKKGKEIMRNPESFNDRQKEVFDKIHQEFLGVGSILNLKATSL